MAIKLFLGLAFCLAVDICLVQSHALPEDGGVDEEVADGYTIPREAAEEVHDFEDENMEADHPPEPATTPTLGEVNEDAMQRKLLQEQTDDLQREARALYHSSGCVDVHILRSYEEETFSSPPGSKLECRWLFVAARSSWIVLDFIKHNVNCNSTDRLQIYQGENGVSQTKCGKQLDEPVVITGNIFDVQFFTLDASKSFFTATAKMILPKACPQTWFFNEETKMLYKHFGSFSFEIGEAEQFCQSLGGGIAMPKTQSQQDFLFDLSGGNIWIALYDTDMDGTYIWGDGEPVTYSNWEKDEPLDGADSASMVNGGKWIGEFRNAFSLTYNVVCQVAPTDITDDAETADPEYFF